MGFVVLIFNSYEQIGKPSDVLCFGAGKLPGDWEVGCTEQLSHQLKDSSSCHTEKGVVCGLIVWKLTFLRRAFKHFFLLRGRGRSKNRVQIRGYDVMHRSIGGGELCFSVTHVQAKNYIFLSRLIGFSIFLVLLTSLKCKPQVVHQLITSSEIRLGRIA